ncbi:hypothetical protein [Streptomyces hokutonensis]|uniref:hypothetical protein n=1 Tax=Streptomyces hokutonensis TaxID=1306990 RepID=UPI0036C0867A
MRILADAYGLEASARGELVDAMLDRQTRNASWWRRRLGDPELRPDDGELIASRVEWSEREHACTSAHRSTFERALLVTRPLAR